MQNNFKQGDQLSIEVTVSERDLAAFNGAQIHPVYSTFALGRDAEWACRQFVLQMKDKDEEGIGTFLTIKHHSPAKQGQLIIFTATVEEIKGNEIICSYKAQVNDRLIASGQQGQKILKKTRIKALFESI